MDFDLQACIRGDKAAWNAFVERYAGVIVAAAAGVLKRQGREMTVDRAAVNDAVQEVYMRLVKDGCRLLQTFDPQRASITTWLTLVARSTTIDGLRKKRLTTVSLDSVTAAGHVPAARPEPASAGQPGHGIEVSPGLLNTLLTARQRLILKLLFEQGQSVGEAAATLGVDEQTIRSGKHKAMTRLREHLGLSTTSRTRPSESHGQE